MVRISLQGKRLRSRGVVIRMQQALVDEFVELVSIDAESGDEGEIAAAVAGKLRVIGLEVEIDAAGNVIGRAGEGEPVILCAHLDRVKPGKGIRPVVEDGVIRSSGDTILAADDVAGIVAILAGLRRAKEALGALPAVEAIFTVGEETHLAGSRRLDYGAVRGKMAYVFDASRPVGVVVTSSPTHVGITARVMGQAAHAAVNPQDGVSAIQAAARGIVRLPFGWVDDHTTANVGMISGGTATNVVCDDVLMRAEVRSLDHDRAVALAEHFANVISLEAATVGARANVTTEVEYRGYRIPSDEPVVRRVVRAIEAMGLEATIESSMGGSDGNIFNANGIASVVLGIGCEAVHSTRERIAISQLEAAARLAQSLLVTA
ncbi:MAG: M20/M25/M40 family metallo-hydrolase [Bacillota bacterium]|nr:M20/M25/M40 family metallo-hydrolase [Bacillota bacterium]